MSQTAKLQLLDGSHVELLSRRAEFRGAWVRVLSDRAVPLGTAIRVDGDSRLLLAEVAACCERGPDYELWLRVRHVLDTSAGPERGTADQHRSAVPVSDAAEWVQVMLRLLEGVRCHAIRGDPAQYGAFQLAMQDMERTLAGICRPDSALEAAETALKTLESYNRQTVEFVRDQFASLEQLVESMLVVLRELREVTKQYPAIQTSSHVAELIESIQVLRGHLTQHWVTV